MLSGIGFSQSLDSLKIDVINIAQKNSYKIIYDSVNIVNPISEYEEFLIWVEKNRKENKTITIQYSEGIYVEIKNKR